MNELTAFQRDMLWTVNKLEDPKGLAIKAELSEYYDEEVNHGRLYPNLDYLVERGFIDKSQKDRRTNEYRVSEKGRRALQQRIAWIDEHCLGGSFE